MTTTPASRRALILFAHGSSDPAWALPFERIRAAMQARTPNVTITLAYLERMSPSLPDAVAALGEVDVIQIAPLFLGVGGHMRNDFPALVSEAQARTRASVSVLPTLGEAPEITDAIASVLAGWTSGYKV